MWVVIGVAVAIIGAAFFLAIGMGVGHALANKPEEIDHSKVEHLFEQEGGEA